MKYPETKDIKIPDRTINKWQNIVDTVAEVLNIPAALIMKAEPPYIKVFRASETEDNPYQVGDKEELDGLYCENVILNDEKLLVPNAVKDEKWKHNPDIELGMISYLGFPLKWPDGEFFGTFCVLDSKENNYGKKAKNLMKEFKELIETHLALIYKNKNLVERRNKLETTLQSIGDGVITTDTNSIVTRMNNTAENLTGWKFEKAKGKKLEEIFEIENAETGTVVENPVEQVMERKETVGLSNDTTLIAKDGTKRQIADSASPIRNDVGNIIGIILVFSDVTEKYEAKKKLEKSEERYRTLFNTMMEGCQIISKEWEYLYINNSLAEQINLSKEKLIGNKMWEVFPDIRKSDMFSVLKKSMEERTIEEIENEFELSEEKKCFQLRIYPVPEGIFVLSKDITKQVEARQKIKEENEWLKVLYEKTEDPIAILDAQHQVIDINKAFEDVFKYNLEEIKGRNMDEVMNMGKENSADESLTEQLLEGKEVEKEGVRYDKKRNPLVCIIEGIPVKVDGELIGAYAIYKDITERKRREEKIEYISYHDNLTSLYNRTFLETEIDRLDVERQLPISMIMIDLNGLKIINDSYGHTVGDKLLMKTADVLRNIFREEDIIARWGGDEFVIFLSQTGEKVAERLVQRIKNSEATVQLESGDELPLSLAVGYGAKMDTSKDIQNLFKKAEDMMYKDKLHEKNSVKVNIVKSLLTTLQQKSPETNQHNERMRKLAIKLGEKIGLQQTEIDKLNLLALLHDIGETVLPAEILNKPKQLTEKEWEKIKNHPSIGYRICSEVEEYSNVANEVLTHHERWDGNGYPKGLKGDNIPIVSRIISIVDAYDVMTHKRPYNKTYTQEEALEELQKNINGQFDPDLTKEFIELLKQ
jgi:diguanylate cyclase (GGDEF)-like protein/PAS domain S-box-containing protein